DREDHVSMGMHAARACDRMNELLAHVLAIEGICGAQGIELRGLSPGVGVGRAVARLRRVVPHLDDDRILAPDLLQTRDLIVAGDLLTAADSADAGDAAVPEG